MSTKEKKPSVTLTSYSIKAIIPTGPYANIQSEIIVSAKTLDEARDYVLPHIDQLFETYLNRSERRVPVVSQTKGTEVKPIAITEVKSTNVVDVTVKPVEPTVAVADKAPENKPNAVDKATNAINSCLTVDALELIAKQIEKSVKLNAMEKLDLGMLVVNKQKALSAKNKMIKLVDISELKVGDVVLIMPRDESKKPRQVTLRNIRDMRNGIVSLLFVGGKNRRKFVMKNSKINVKR